MALLASEAARIKSELGYSVLTSGAIPYRDVWSTFDEVIQNYVQSGATTTSATPVTSTGAVQQVTLALASATGFSSGAAVVVDVDSLQERATIQNLSGTSCTVLLKLAHSGTYPVTVEGGETLVRAYLRQLVSIADKLAAGWDTAGVAQVDEVRFHAPKDGLTNLHLLRQEQTRLRNELAAILNVPNMHARRGSGVSAIALR